MTTACIVQARLGSTRLPAKVLLPLPTGRTVLEEVLFRCKRIPGVDVVALSTPKGPSARILHPLMVRHAHICIGHDGVEDDVLGRYELAARITQADTIMRITADCPLIDPEVCGRLLHGFQHSNAGYGSNCWPHRRYPHGFDCEVFSRTVLDWANLQASGSYDREHVCPWMQRQEDIVRLYVGPPVTEPDRSHERLTLDTLDDYVHIWDVLREQMEGGAV
jgi:spore coat polysaccharide biosynthesis protein SpsF (cytidylyltransferase family)